MPKRPTGRPRYASIRYLKRVWRESETYEQVMYATGYSLSSLEKMQRAYKLPKLERERDFDTGSLTPKDG